MYSSSRNGFCMYMFQYAELHEVCIGEERVRRGREVRVWREGWW